MDVEAAITCNNFPGTTQMNFNPGMAVMNGVLYIGFEAYDNSHQLLFYKSTDQGQPSPLCRAQNELSSLAKRRTLRFAAAALLCATGQL